MSRKDIKVLFFSTTTNEIVASLNDSTANGAGTELGVWSHEEAKGTFFVDTDGVSPVVKGAMATVSDLTAWINIMQQFRRIQRSQMPLWGRNRYAPVFDEDEENNHVH